MQENKKYIFGAGLFAIIIGIIFYLSSLVGVSTDTSPETNSSIMPSVPAEEAGENVQGYQGKLLAGSYDKVPYIEFNNADYQKAISEGKIVYLEFYASWCPTCRAQEQAILPAFKNVNRSDIVAFRTNYNDPYTDDVEKSLATHYGVTYQHQKVILKGDQELLNINKVWTASELITTLSNL